MVTQTLTKEMIDDGDALLRALDAGDVGVTAAFWFYLEESDTWTLIIGSPEVQSAGPKRLYERIQKVLGSGSGLGLRNVSVLPADDPIIELLKTAIKTAPNDVSGIRFSRNTINGTFVEDAYVYRLA